MPHRLFADLARHKRHLVAAALLSVVVGCGTAPEHATNPALYADTRARALGAEGHYAAAAAEYLRIAELAPSPDAEQYRLAAADDFLAARDPARARAVLDHPSLKTGGTAVQSRRAILLADATLIEGDTDGALAQLHRLDLDALPPYLAREARQVLARALAKAGDLRAAARQRVALELLLTDPEEIAANRRELWESLSSLPRSELESMRRPPPDTLGGWVDLALIRQRYLADPAALEAALGKWSRAFPGHPANQGIVAALREESRALGTPARHIALFLPLGGEYAEAARAIRDGFLASWFVSEPPERRPAVSVYDTEGADMAALLARAVAAGADFVVGPLRKEAVAAVIAAGPTVPVLALNAPGSAATADTETVYRFALSPESEAEQAAEKAWFDGHAQALVLTPDSSWGERVADAFETRWSSLGGTVAAAARYGSDPNALAETVRTVLNVDRSEARARQLRRILGVKLEHEPRRRQDIDAIFLAGFPGQARQVRPQIDFFRASRVPVYATSHVYSGQPNPNADGDINGVVFGDMPWVLGSADRVGDLRERVVALWPAAAGSFTRFYAFGADAHRLVGEVGRLRAQSGSTYQGYTGELSLAPDLRVHRRLEWAIFDNGVPKPLSAPDG